jgi:hypothetical protein
MTDTLACWKCGADLNRLPLPLGRRAECPACRTGLHVCRMCRHYDPGKARQCREPMAEEVKDKTRANFCEWFQPRPDACSPADSGKDGARAALDGLFGGEVGKDPGTNSASPDPRGDLDRLFGD